MNKYQRYANLSKGKILDIGCAETPNPYLKGDVTGIDIQNMKEIPKNYSRYIKANLNTYKFSKKHTFDTVIMAEVIEHVENPSMLLRQTNSILKNNGRLILSVPHATHWWTIMHNWFFPFIRDQDEGWHLSNWTKLDMIRLLKKNGFKVKKIYGEKFSVPLLPIHIPVGSFHMFSYVLIFECIKKKKPDNSVLTSDFKRKKIRIKQ
jgi:SAM-dependent methyltransferase